MDHECYEFSSAPESGRGKQKHCNMLPDQNMRKTHHTVGEPELSVTTSAKKSFVPLIFVRPNFELDEKTNAILTEKWPSNRNALRINPF